MPLPVMPVYQLFPPSVDRKIPPPTIRTTSEGFFKLYVLIPDSFQITDWSCELDNIKELFKTEFYKTFTLIVPSVSIIPAVLLYYPVLYSNDYVAAVIRWNKSSN
jgi:hypothetical protein